MVTRLLCRSAPLNDGRGRNSNQVSNSCPFGVSFINNNSLLPLYILAFLVFGGIAMLFPVVSPFAASLGADVPTVGYIVAIQLYVTGILVAPIGLLINRFGRKNLFVCGILLNIVSFGFYLFASNLNLLTIGRVLGGLASGALYPASSTIVVDAVVPEKRGEALGWLTTSSQLGSMLGPAAGGVLLKYTGFKGVFLAAITVMVLSAVIAFRKLKVAPISSLTGQQSNPDKRDKCDNEIIFCQKNAKNNFLRTKLDFRWIGDRQVIIALLSILMVNCGLSSVNSFLPLYGVEIGIGIDIIGLIIASLYLGSVVMRALGGWLSDRAGRVPVIMGGLLLCTLGILGVSIFVREAPLHLAAFLFGMGMGLCLPAAAAFLADLAPFSMRGLAMGLYAAAFHAGQAFGATALGLVAASTGFRNMYLTAAVVIGLLFVLIPLLAGKKKGLTP